MPIQQNITELWRYINFILLLLLLLLNKQQIWGGAPKLDCYINYKFLYRKQTVGNGDKQFVLYKLVTVYALQISVIFLWILTSCSRKGWLVC